MQQESGYSISRKNRAASSCFPWKSHHSSLAGRPVSAKKTQLCSPAKKRYLSAHTCLRTAQTRGYSQGDTGMGSPHLPPQGTDQTRICRVQHKKAQGVKGRWTFWWHCREGKLCACVMCPGGSHSPWLGSTGMEWGTLLWPKNSGAWRKSLHTLHRFSLVLVKGWILYFTFSFY